MKLTMIELFSGIGAQIRGFKNSGLFDTEVIATSEIDKDAIVSYAAIHCGLTPELIESYDYPPVDEMVEYLESRNIGYVFEKNKAYDWQKKRNSADLKKYYLASVLSKNMGDISKIEELPYADFVTYSFPCITEDSYILTKDGYKQMKDIEVGDIVLTKSNTWHPIVKKFDNGIHETCYLDAMGFENIHCTLNHKFYVREKYKTYPTYENGKRGNIRHFKEPVFKEAKDLTKNDYFGIPVIQEEIPFYTNDLDFWYMIGYYIGDGYLSVNGYDIRLCCNDSKLEKLISHLDINKYHYTISDKDLSCHKLRFADKEIHRFISTHIGSGCHDKRIPSEILFLPNPQLKAFLDGYIDSDGNICQDDRYVRISSVNKQLIYSTSLIINKLHHCPTSIYKSSERKREHRIDGRTISQGDLYEVKFKTNKCKQDKAFYEDGYIWYPFNKLIPDKKEHVYNIEVEEDHSYILQGCISKNCTDISIAGQIQGIERGKTRSGLLYEVERLLAKAKETDTLPKFLLLENVKNLVSQRFKPQFNEWCDYLSEIGYNTYWQIVNAKDCGIPQNRERVFAVSIRKDVDTGKFEFPQAFDIGIRLFHVLDFDVNEKYILTSDAAGKALNEMANNGTLSEEEEMWNELYETRNDFPNYGIICNQPIYTSNDVAVGGAVPMNDQNGYCRTLKQQYAKTAIQNLQSKGTFGATGVIQWK